MSYFFFTVFSYLILLFHVIDPTFYNLVLLDINKWRSYPRPNYINFLFDHNNIKAIIELPYSSFFQLHRLNMLWIKYIYMYLYIYIAVIHYSTPINFFIWFTVYYVIYGISFHHYKKVILRIFKTKFIWLCMLPPSWPRIDN